ncbi:MAG: TolC family protein [Ginsengibacter sp.]
MHCKNLVLVCALLFTRNIAMRAQDTLHMTLPQAQTQFFNQNLDLIAEKYNIDIAKAEALQSSLLNNPEVSFAGNIHNPEAGKYFDFINSTGDYSFEVQQLITLAGKRNKQMKIAETNTLLAQSSFSELVRSLLYSLRTDFYSLFFLQQSLNAYKMQISSLQKLADSYSQLQLKGTVTLKDAVRIKSLLFSLLAEQAELLNQIHDIQMDLQILLHFSGKYIIADLEKDVRQYAPWKNTTIQSLTDSAFMNRPDLQIAKKSIVLN